MGTEASFIFKKYCIVNDIVFFDLFLLASRVGVLLFN